MYIEKWWGEFFGGTDDSLTLMDYFEEDATTEYSLANIFSDFNLNIQKSFDSFRSAEEIYYFTKCEKRIDIYYAINFLLDIGVIILESLHSGNVSLKNLNSNSSDKNIVITADVNTLNYLISILADFSENPLAYDLAEMCDENDMLEISRQCKEVIIELKRFV